MSQVGSGDPVGEPAILLRQCQLKTTPYDSDSQNGDDREMIQFTLQQRDEYSVTTDRGHVGTLRPVGEAFAFIDARHLRLRRS
jgi:hypothetical protein